jgi:hypothetical protein
MLSYFNSGQLYNFVGIHPEVENTTYKEGKSNFPLRTVVTIR